MKKILIGVIAVIALCLSGCSDVGRYQLYKDGYFKEGIVPLDSQHELRNYEKSIKWLEEGILPGFLK